MELYYTVFKFWLCSQQNACNIHPCCCKNKQFIPFYYWVKSRDTTLPSSQACGFSSGHVWMWKLDCEESWTLKNWWFWTVVLEKTLESPLDCKDIQPVHSKGDQSWVFSGRTDAKAETPVLWPPLEKSWLIGKTLMLRGIVGRRRRGWQRMR